MKRKVISLILAAAMLGSILTGCGGGKDTSSGGGQEQSKEPAEDSAKPEADDSSEAEPAEAASSDTENGEELSGTLSILSWYDETKAAPVLEAFKAKYPNVTVDFQYSPPVADYVEKLSTLLYSGAGPDIFYMALENREDLIKGNYVEDLSAEPYMANGIIPDSVKTTYGADGKAYSLAVDCWVGGIFYNKDIFDQVGITEEPKTWDELLAVCQKLKDAGIQPIMDNCQDAAVNFTAPLYGSEVKAGNANIVQDIYDGKATFKDTWTTPVTMWKEGLIDNGYLTADMVGATSDEIVSAFATGQVAMILSGSWNLNT
ncbi:MAG: extracellular solute-binding protein, partial [Lachnospiraceae bacterium]|nr:extracellular solute-binding protein [Lachnospiraceae bacterium]